MRVFIYRLDYTISEMILKGLDRFTIEYISTIEKSLEVSFSLRFPMLTLLSGMSFITFTMDFRLKQPY